MARPAPLSLPLIASNVPSADDPSRPVAAGAPSGRGFASLLSIPGPCPAARLQFCAWPSKLPPSSFPANPRVPLFLFVVLAMRHGAVVSRLLRARRILGHLVHTARRDVRVLTRRGARRHWGAVATLRTAHAACLVAHLVGDLWSGRRRRLPPVTAALVATLLAIHVVRGAVGVWMPPPLRLSTAAVCIRPAATLAARRLAVRRVVGSVVAHVDAAHVLYNVAAAAAWLPPFEATAGPGGTAALLFVLAVVAHGLTVLLATAVAAVGVAPAAGRACIVGASGVLFGVQVLRDAAPLATRPGRRGAPAATRLVGGGRFAPGLPAVRVPVRAAPIIEAALLSAVHPRASAIGHAAGIGAGWVVVAGVFGGRALIAAAARWWAGVVRRRGGATLQVAAAEGEGVDSSAGGGLGDGAARERAREDGASEEVTLATTEESWAVGGLRHRQPHAVADE